MNFYLVECPVAWYKTLFRILQMTISWDPTLAKSENLQVEVMSLQIYTSVFTGGDIHPAPSEWFHLCLCPLSWVIFVVQVCYKISSEFLSCRMPRSLVQNFVPDSTNDNILRSYLSKIRKLTGGSHVATNIHLSFHWRRHSPSTQWMISRDRDWTSVFQSDWLDWLD
jgi:hypothetical protein